ncbi:hypothetical protein C8R44DRAFT_773589 [Mycena epipterygia]|nr:hypothetical protein C8R44DRAFT_773589 [Mycena epipterygia]
MQDTHNHEQSGCQISEQEDDAVDLLWEQVLFCSQFGSEHREVLATEESKIIHQALYDLLWNCLNTKMSVDEIRALIPQQYRVTITQHISPFNSGSLLEHSLHAKAFRHKYAGDTHLLFLRTIDYYMERLQKENTYSFSVAIIQSSCTGKTRMMHQAALSRFAFVINVREALGDREYTYPPADDEVRSFLVDSKELRPVSMTALVIRYRAFLTSLFSHARRILKALSTDAISSTLLRVWCEYLAPGSQTRSEFFRNVVNMPSERLEEMGTRLEAEVTALVLTLDTLGINGSDAGSVKILLVLDEAHTLADQWVHDPNSKTGPQGTPIPRSFLSVLDRVLNSIRTYPIFTVYLSTNSKLGGLAPLRSRHPSSRMQHPEQLIPPLTELTDLDVFVEAETKKVLEHGVTLNKVCDPILVSSFGRPQWTTLLYARKNAVDSHETQPQFTSNDFQHVIDFAKSKLTTIGTDVNDAHIAWLSLRILLDIDTNTEGGKALNATLVNSYQRIVFSVPLHRLWMHTGAPSEPILVEAAGRLMHHDESGILNPVWVLDNHLVRGLIAKGERGEILARLLIILAHDRAAEKSPPIPNLKTNGLRYHRPIKVLDFIRHLFTPQAYDIIAQATPLVNSPQALTLQKAFEMAYMHVSHFVLAGDSAVVDCQYLWNLFPRGAALQCRNNQVAIDCVAPIVFTDSPDAPLTAQDFSAIQIQVKNREAPKDLIVSTSKVRPFPEDSERPILSFVFEFGAPGQHVSVDHVDRIATHTGGRPTSVIYQITIRGLDAFSTGAWHTDAMKRVLQASPPFMDFPRADLPENMDRLYRMHPYYTAQGKTATDLMDKYASVPSQKA